MARLLFAAALIGVVLPPQTGGDSFNVFAISKQKSDYFSARKQCQDNGGVMKRIGDNATYIAVQKFSARHGGNTEYFSDYLKYSTSGFGYTVCQGLTINATACLSTLGDVLCYHQRFHICQFTITNNATSCAALAPAIPHYYSYQDPKLCLRLIAGSMNIAEETLIQRYPTCEPKTPCKDPTGNRVCYKCATWNRSCERYYVRAKYWLAPWCNYKQNSTDPDYAQCLKELYSNCTTPSTCSGVPVWDGKKMHLSNGSSLYMCFTESSMLYSDLHLNLTCVKRSNLTTTSAPSQTSAAQTTQAITTVKSSSTHVSATATTAAQSTAIPTYAMDLTTGPTTNGYTSESPTTAVRSTTVVTATQAHTTAATAVFTSANHTTGSVGTTTVSSNASSRTLPSTANRQLLKFDSTLTKCAHRPPLNGCTSDNIKIQNSTQLQKAIRSQKPIAVFANAEVFDIGSVGNQSVSVVTAVTKPPVKLLDSYIPPPAAAASRGGAIQTQDVPLQSLVHLQVVTKAGKRVSTSVTYKVALTEQTVRAKQLTAAPAGGVVRLVSAEVKCVFLDETTFLFSSVGMRVVYDGAGGYNCTSNHTTVFAVLLSLVSVTVPGSVQILSYVTESISVFFLILTLGVLLRVRRKLRSDRTTVQINLSLALLMLHFWNLIQEGMRFNSEACELTAVMIHFFLLGSAFWMLLEGVTLVTKTMDSAMHSGSTRNLTIMRFAVGWGIPAIIVIVAAASGFPTESYMNHNPILLTSSLAGVNRYSKCWLSPTSGVLLGAVIVPVAVTLALDAIILVRVSWFVYKMSKQADNYKPTADRGHGPIENADHLKATLKATFLLLPVLGVPWLFGFLSGPTVGFMYVTVLVNGLQGFFLFVIYILLGKEVRRALLMELQRTSLGSAFESTSGKLQKSLYSATQTTDM